MRIAIVGAPQTGKSQLARAISQHLSHRHIDLVVLDATSVEQLQSDDIVLLCGLDFNTPASDVQQLADDALRTALGHQKIAYQVVYGLGAERCTQALYAAAQRAQALGREDLAAHMRQPLPLRWTGACENCADADCEHRLFSQLLEKKTP
jgi:dephospho-CoA kinase